MSLMHDWLGNKCHHIQFEILKSLNKHSLSVHKPKNNIPKMKWLLLLNCYSRDPALF